MNEGVLNGGIVAGGDTVFLGPRDGLTLHDPLDVRLAITILLAYMATNGVDVAQAINGAKLVASGFCTGSDPTQTLEGSAIAAAVVEHVPGIVACSATFGERSFDPISGAFVPPATSFPSIGSTPYLLTANSVRCADPTFA